MILTLPWSLQLILEIVVSYNSEAWLGQATKFLVLISDDLFCGVSSPSLGCLKVVFQPEE